MSLSRGAEMETGTEYEKGGYETGDRNGITVNRITPAGARRSLFINNAGADVRSQPSGGVKSNLCADD